MQTTTNSEDFNASKVPEMEIESIARAILDIADTVMAKPGMKERYEEWKKKRGVKNAAGAI